MNYLKNLQKMNTYILHLFSFPYKKQTFFMKGALLSELFDKKQIVAKWHSPHPLVKK